MASIARNVVANWGASLVGAVTGLFIAPLVVRALGSDEYGVWVLVGSLTGPLSLLDLGVRSAVTRQIARSKAQSDHEASGRTLRAARRLYAASAGLAVLVTVLLTATVVSLYKLPEGLIWPARVSLLLAGSSLAIGLYGGAFGGLLAGVQRLDLIGMMNIVAELGRIALVATVLWLEGGIAGLGVVVFVLALGRLAFQRVMARRSYPEAFSPGAPPSPEDYRAIFAISAVSTAIYAFGMLSANTSVYILGALRPLREVGEYSIGTTLPSYLMAFSLPIAQVVLPRSSELAAVGDLHGLRRLVLQSSRLGTLLLLPVAVGFITRGGTFLALWMGPEHRGTAEPVLQIFALTCLMSLPRHVGQTALIGAGQHRPIVPWYVVEFGLVAVMTYLLTPQWGTVGTAWSAVVPFAIVALAGIPALMRQHLGLPWWQGIIQCYVRPLGAMLPFALGCWWMESTVAATSYVAFFAQMLAVVPLAVAGAWFIGLDADERQMLIARLRR